MSPEMMDISIVIQTPRLMPGSLNHSDCLKQMARKDTHLSRSLRAEDVAQSPCIALFVRHFTEGSPLQQALSVILTDRETTMSRRIFLGEHMLKTKPTKDGTERCLRGSATAKPRCPPMPSASSAHQCHLDYGMRLMPQRFSVLTPPLFVELQRASGVGKALSNSTHGPGAWDANPWICALTFSVQRANIDRRE